MSATTTPNTQVSSNMLDEYELLAELGAGGMGVVYLARLVGLAGFERLVAIKLVHPHLQKHGESVHLLLDEARLSAKIHHPNVVPITNVCESERGFYVVMDYIEGFALDELLGHPDVDADLRPRLAVRAIVDAAQGLEAAHRLMGNDGRPLELVHRDVSPQNILVGVDGLSRLIDFGVARAKERLTQTENGFTRGKPCYMSPEQARAMPVDARADVFALGAVLWEALTGRMLFKLDGGIAAVLARVQNAHIEPPSSVNPKVPPALDAVCMRALSRDLEARTPSARQLALELEEAAKDGFIASHRELSEHMKALFQDALVERRTLLSSGARARLGSDVFEVPRLQRPRDSLRSIGIAQTTPQATARAHGLGSRGPARSVAESSASRVATDSETRSARSRWVLPIVVIMALGLASALAWSLNRSADQDKDKPLAREPSTAAITNPEVTAPATKPRVEPEPVVAPPAPAAVDPTEAAAVKPSKADADEQRPAATRSARRTNAQTATSKVSSEPAHAESPSKAPAPAMKLETNPYQYSGSKPSP